MSRNVIKHVSIDLNGEYDSLVLDLDNPVPEYLLGDFNWVTNYGTVEHVNNQYMVFKNIHDLCCIGGIMLHALVPPGHWVGHGRYHHSIEFINKLAQCCRYSILLLEKTKYYDNPKKNGLFVTYKKEKNDFISENLFKTLPIVDTKNLSHTGNYKAK